MVDVVYHLQDSDLIRHLEDCLYAMSQMDPELFSDRGKINLQTLVSDEAQ